jgi:cellulose synthase/poly-beta-1,6-N-acetylglucosamine synthase-like glycosyltransferase
MSDSFWLQAVMIGSAAWLAFAYVGYPLALYALSRLSLRPVRRADIAPPLSVIIAVHNGEAALREKLEATLALRYPGSVEVIVASDGSTDGSDAIAMSFAERGVQLARTPERGGKEAAQANAIEHASGEILVFTDVTAELEPDALEAIVRPFADPTVGCVSSEDVVDTEGGESAYVRLEMALRRLESETTTLIGLSGSCFAARREICKPWPSDLASDFRIGLEATRRGLRAVSEPGAKVHFSATQDPAAEWSRKVRTIRRGIAVLAAHRDLLHPRYGRAALSIWGHKVARFTSPFALLALLLGSALGAPSSASLATLLGLQLGAYALGGLALLRPEAAQLRIGRLAGFFMLVNASMLVAWAHHLSGQKAVTWQPTRR